MKKRFIKFKDKISYFVNDFLYCHLEVIIVAIIFMIFVVATYVLEYSNANELTIEVKDKFIKSYDGYGTYIVIDNNDNAYKISDLIFLWKFNSTDIYSSIKIGKKYKINTTGIRLGLFSEYPNINSVYEIEE